MPKCQCSKRNGEDALAAQRNEIAFSVQGIESFGRKILYYPLL